MCKRQVAYLLKIFADLENNRSTGVPDFVCATSSISVEPDSCS